MKCRTEELSNILLSTESIIKITIIIPNILELPVFID